MKCRTELLRAGFKSSMLKSQLQSGERCGRSEDPQESPTVPGCRRRWQLLQLVDVGLYLASARFQNHIHIRGWGHVPLRTWTVVRRPWALIVDQHQLFPHPDGHREVGDGQVGIYDVTQDQSPAFDLVRDRSRICQVWHPIQTRDYS